MAAGEFGSSALPYVLEGMDSVWKGGRHNRGLKKDVTPAQEILARQMVDWQLLFDKAGLNNAQRCVEAKVTWLKDCTDTVRNSVTLSDCDLDGTEMESDVDTYAPNLSSDIHKKVKGDSCKDYFDKARKIGVAIANMTYALDQNLQKQLETFITANGQANRFSDTYGTIESGQSVYTTFTAEEWIPKIIAQLVRTADMNDLHNYYGLSGGLLYDYWLNGQFNNCCDSDRNYFNSDVLDIFFDTRNFDTIATQPTLALVDAGAFGYYNAYSYTSNTPVPLMRGGDLYGWRVPSERLTWNNGGRMEPVYYDFELQDTCTVKSDLRYIDTVIRGAHKGGLHLGPETCTDGDTGILLFGVTEPEEGGGGGT